MSGPACSASRRRARPARREPPPAAVMLGWSSLSEALAGGLGLALGVGEVPTGEPPCHRHSRRHLSSHHGSKRMRIRLLLGIPIVCGQHAQPRLGPGATWQHFARIRSVLPFESARRGPWAASRTCEHRRAPSVDGGKRAVTPAVRCVGFASFAAAAPWLPACPGCGRIRGFAGSWSRRLCSSHPAGSIAGDAFRPVCITEHACKFFVGVIIPQTTLKTETVGATYNQGRAEPAVDQDV